MRNDKLDNLTIKRNFQKGLSLILFWVLSVNPKICQNPQSPKGYGHNILSQTQGMGRQGRSFLSNEGDVISALSKRRKGCFERHTFDVGSPKSCLEKYGCACQIKWPNDILIKGKNMRHALRCIGREKRTWCGDKCL